MEKLIRKAAEEFYPTKIELIPYTETESTEDINENAR